MERLAIDSDSASSSAEGLHTPNENDLLITRLVARIAELEEKLYKQELDAPAIVQRTPAPTPQQPPPPTTATTITTTATTTTTPSHALGNAAGATSLGPRFKESLLATLRESWAKLDIGSASQTPVAGQQWPPQPQPSVTAVVPGTPGGAATAAATAAAASAVVSTPTRAGTPGSRTKGLAAAEGVDKESAAEDGLQTHSSFNFSTQLVVDYSKPTRGSSSSENERPGDFGGFVKSTPPPKPKTRLGRLRNRSKNISSDGNAGGGEEGGAGFTSSDGTDDDSSDDQLTSPDSTGMGYEAETEREEAARQRERRDSYKLAGPGSGPIVRPPSLGSGGGAAGGGGGGDTPGRVSLRTMTAAAAGGRVSVSDGGGGGSAPAAPPPPPPLPPQPPPPPAPSAPSRAAAWSGSVLSKLGLSWGRGGDRNNTSDPRDNGPGGFSMTRNGSAGSLQQYPGAFSDRALEELLTSGGVVGGGAGGPGGLPLPRLGMLRGMETGEDMGVGSYYRYVFDPADVQAEMEVTARVRRAAAEALMEANAKLAAAQAAAEALQQQVEQAKQLEQELEVLRSERSAAQAAKASLEDEVGAVRRQLDGMKETEGSLQAELEGVRSQADIWRSSKDGEAEKLKQENNLLRSQLTNRLSELQSCRTRLGEGEAERQRMVREAEDLQSKIQWLTKINLQLEAAASQLQDTRRAAAEWQERFMRERNVRRRLHDQLQQLRGNIRVMCRVRPVQPGQRDIVSYPLEGLLAVSPPDRRYQEFEFDHVFPPSADQGLVFDEAVASLVRSVADGFSACIFAFGQTGSGKTHTMQGPPEDPGIYVRALRELFRIAREEEEATSSPRGARQARLSAASGGSGGGNDGSAPSTATAAAGTGVNAATHGSAVPLGRYSFEVSMLEIYNEAVYDLLAKPPSEGGPGATRPSLDVSGLGAGELPPGVDRVSGLTWRPVGCTEDVEGLIREGGRNRATAATALNAHSSRSHALLSVWVTVTTTTTTTTTTATTGPAAATAATEVAAPAGAGAEAPGGAASGGSGGVSPSVGAGGEVVAAVQQRRGVSCMMHLVDLAGSERVEKSGVTGQKLKEAQSINRSLSALGDVISALQRRSPHTPYRNSKLTAVLQDSLCGNSKVLLVCNVAPESTSASETLSSLNFASRAAQVELGYARRASDRSGPVAQPSASTPGGTPADRESGGSSGRGSIGASSGAAGGSSSSQAPPPPPLPIMNGTAAKVRAAAAAAATGGGGMRTSQSWVGGGSGR